MMDIEDQEDVQSDDSTLSPILYTLKDDAKMDEEATEIKIYPSLQDRQISQNVHKQSC
jgi:hypothetical protein